MKSHLLAGLLVLLLLFISACGEEETTQPVSGDNSGLAQNKPASSPSNKPAINTISPTSGEIGDVLTINGSGFGASQVFGSYVLFDGTPAAGTGVYLEWTDTKIRVLVPSGHLPGTLDVMVKLKTSKSGTTPFTLVACTEVMIGGNGIPPLVWSGANLDVSTYANGDPIPQVTDATAWDNLTTGAWCYPNNDPVLGSFYGKLYNWYAVNDSRGIVPSNLTGWRVPSDDEWKKLSMSLGMSAAEADLYGFTPYFGTDEGGKMKECGNNLWPYPNTGATNESGFTALPGGMRSGNSSYDFTGQTGGVWWSSTEDPDGTVWVRALDTNSPKTYRNKLMKTHGFFVRLVRDPN